MVNAPADAVEFSKVRRALVVKLRHHGDVLLASPVFTALKNRAPHIEVDALVYGDTREMLSFHPAISQLHVVERRWKELSPISRAAAEWALLSELRSRNYDLLIHLTEHPRGAWLARFLGCRHSVAPDDSGRTGFWRASFTHRYPLASGRHSVELNLDALRRIGMQPAEDERRLVLVPGPEADAGISAMLSATRLPEKGFIHLHPASRWQFKCWTVECTAGLVDRLQERGERIVITAAPDERELALVAAIRSRCGSEPVDFSGRLTLKMLAGLAARAKLFIGVDSAPMHIASAMGVPVVALFGPSGEARWGPWKVPHRVVTSNAHPCRPCGYDGCGGGKVSECLSSIPVERVVEAVDSLLRG